MKKKYVLISGRTPEELEKIVNIAMKAGLVPLSGPATQLVKEKGPNGDFPKTIFHQAMIEPAAMLTDELINQIQKRISRK